jgi:hypothetical protein
MEHPGRGPTASTGDEKSFFVSNHQDHVRSAKLDARCLPPASRWPEGPTTHLGTNSLSISHTPAKVNLIRLER